MQRFILCVLACALTASPAVAQRGGFSPSAIQGMPGASQPNAPKVPQLLPPAQPSVKTPDADKVIVMLIDALKGSQAGMPAADKAKCDKALLALTLLLLPEPANVPAKKAGFALDSLRSAAIGKTLAEVSAIIGEPVRSARAAGGTNVSFNAQATDAKTKAVSESVVIFFDSRTQLATIVTFWPGKAQ
jgi:hypothetical protein